MSNFLEWLSGLCISRLKSSLSAFDSLYCFSEPGDNSFSIPSAPLQLLLFPHSAVPLPSQFTRTPVWDPQSSAYIPPTCSVFPDPSTSSSSSPNPNTLGKLCVCVHLPWCLFILLSSSAGILSVPDRTDMVCINKMPIWIKLLKKINSEEISV